MRKKVFSSRSSVIPCANVSLNQGKCPLFGFSSYTFPAVAMEQCGSGRDPSEAGLVHTLRGCSEDCPEKPNPPCDVSGVKFQREEAWGPYLFEP